VPAASEPDLFWAIRGGGGNFGVVTEFEFALTEVGPMLNLGLFMVKPEDGRALFEFARDYVKDLPDDCGVFLAGLSAPPAPFVPEHLHMSPAFAIAVVGFGDAESHAKLIAPIRVAVDPIVELVTSIPYAGLQTMFDESAPWGFQAYEKAVHLRELSDGAIDAILEHQAKKMFPLSFVPIFVMGGAYARAADDATAFGGDRGIGYVVNISGMTPNPDDFEAERSWVRDYWSALVKHADGVGSYVNFMSEPDGERVRSAYGEKYPRLQAIKATYDPDNVFHLNANIEPGT
jgi:FAD/FMN-containing dehydrogenase